MPRFVLLYHDCPPGYERRSHWDLMLESGDTLRTWALERLPRAWQLAHEETRVRQSHCPPMADGNEVNAEALANHRRAYLEYEGEVSRNRGEVIRVAAGTYEVLRESAAQLDLALQGDRIHGSLRLVREEANARKWSLEASD